ncbi:hypothetical protein VL20_4977 [Microcystis panniformis FACHB-1757]|uniref:Uncharacterized protein n=1 Tax=Microcystis panniformis FACHB-1757 TaxID=1638788 RepID=A0A0K1S6U4_9CHRO|nr:hypothetical protein VL20_4977 [Microcystis panniformis FACHB-1757]
MTFLNFKRFFRGLGNMSGNLSPHGLSVISYQLSVISDQLSVISYQLSC